MNLSPTSILEDPRIRSRVRCDWLIPPRYPCERPRPPDFTLEGAREDQDQPCRLSICQVFPEDAIAHVENLDTQYWLHIRRWSGVPSN